MLIDISLLKCTQCGTDNSKKALRNHGETEMRDYDEAPNCRFELGIIPCYRCGQPSDDLGTCEDIALCPECRKEIQTSKGISDAEMAQEMVQMIEREGHPFRPPQRKMHMKTATGTVCGLRTPQPVTEDKSKVTCKKCKGQKHGTEQGFATTK